MTFLKSFHPNIPNLIIGYTTRRHLLLDLDNISQKKACMLTEWIQKEWYKVGDCLIVKSSKGKCSPRLLHLPLRHPKLIYARDNHHLIFDNSIGYNSCCKIIETLADIDILDKDYAKIRKFRGDMTLRVSPACLLRGYKTIPEPVQLVPSRHTIRHDGYIRFYLYILYVMRGMYENRPSYVMPKKH